MDRRRLLGPANAITPAIGVSSNPKDNLTTNTNNTTETDATTTGAEDKFFVQAGNIDNANGLCYMEVGDGLIILACSVYGPRPINNLFISRGLFLVETKFMPHVPQANGGTTNGPSFLELTGVEQRLSLFVETSLLPLVLLSRYPKLTIDVYVHVIACDDPSNLHRLALWMVNCALVALVDAEIEVRDVVTLGASGAGVASFMALADDGIVGLWLDGDANDVTTTLPACADKAAAIRANINSYLLNRTP